MIKIESRTQLVGIVFSVLFSIALAIVVALKGNQHWASPLIALGVMVAFGEFPMGGKRAWFQYVYAALVLTSGVIFLFSDQYWGAPFILVTLVNVFDNTFYKVPEIDFGNTLKIDFRKSKTGYYDAFADHDSK